MVINFYSVLTVLNLSNMLKCVLLYFHAIVYMFAIATQSLVLLTKIILQSRGRIVHCVVAKRPGGETSWGRNVQGAN